MILFKLTIFLFIYQNNAHAQDRPYAGMSIATYLEKLAAPKLAAEAKLSAIESYGGFKNSNLSIYKNLPVNGSLNYLYKDIDFIFIENSEYCPNKKIDKYDIFKELEVICSRVEYKDFDNKSFSILIKSKVNNSQKKLLVYNHGHMGFPLQSDTYAVSLFDVWLGQGNDILIVSMPFTGLDSANYPIKIKTFDGPAIFNPDDFSWPFWPHGIFDFYDVGQSSFMRFFVDSTVINVKNLAPLYSSISYLGLSGGAQTGLYSCALLKDVLNQCILASGVMPIRFRLSKKSLGDYEQYNKEFHQKHNVIDVVKEISLSKTKLTLTYNSDDGCCFNGADAEKFEKLLVENQLHHKLNFFIYNNPYHDFNTEDVLSIISN